MRKCSTFTVSNQNMHIHVRAYPDSKKEIIKRLTESRFAVYVKESPKDNAANKRILEIMRKEYAGQTIRMVKGHHSPSKLFSITKKKS